MLENHSYNQTIGNSAAPYENGLASECGNATQAYGATHSSAANYLATSAGQYPAASPNGCGYTVCANSEPNIYQQLDGARLTWKAYEESMPSACDKSDAPPYKIGHNPPIFYTGIGATECQSNDIGVPSLTTASGAFWDELQAGTLPAVSWITPNTSNNGENSCGGNCALSVADTWLQNFMANVTASGEYQAGNTLVLITYDEGKGNDYAIGEDCTNEASDLGGSQPSCQVPLLVVYPYTQGGNDSTFFDHYSVTKTVEDIFGLPYLAHAADAQTNSLAGHFGILAGVKNPAPTVSITQPAGDSTVSGTVTVSGTAQAQGSASIAQVQVSAGNQAPQPATGTASWTASIDTTALANGIHTITAQATDTDGGTGSTSITVNVQNGTGPSACPATPAGATELSGNVSVESGKTGWQGPYNSNSVVTRVEPAGGSYDGLWALQIAGKLGPGKAGVSNARPVWVPGSPGLAATTGQKYIASAFVEANTPGEQVSLLVKEMTPQGSAAGKYTSTVTLNDTRWHQIRSAYTAKYSGDSIRYSLYVSNLASAGQDLLADCLSLQTP
jgi:hypothetical protein